MYRSLNSRSLFLAVTGSGSSVGDSRSLFLDISAFYIKIVNLAGIFSDIASVDHMGLNRGVAVASTADRTQESEV